jgi:hypothetical protein
MPDSFISYTSIDSKLAEFVVSLLATMNITAWLDRSSLPLGTSMERVIQESISESLYFFVLVTDNSEKSNWVQNETRYAIELYLKNGQPRIVPIFVGNRQDGVLFALTNGYLGLSISSESDFESELPDIKRRIFADISRDAHSHYHRGSGTDLGDGLRSFVPGRRLDVRGRIPTWSRHTDQFLFVQRNELWLSNDLGKSAVCCGTLPGDDINVDTILVSNEDRMVAITTDSKDRMKQLLGTETMLFIWGGEKNRLFDLTSNGFLLAGKGSGVSMAWCPDGKRLAMVVHSPRQNRELFSYVVAIIDAELDIENVHFSDAVVTEEFTCAFPDIYFSPDGTRVAVLAEHGMDDEIYVFDSYNGATVSKTIQCATRISWWNNHEILTFENRGAPYRYVTRSADDLSVCRMIGTSGPFRPPNPDPASRAWAWWDHSSDPPALWAMLATDLKPVPLAVATQKNVPVSAKISWHYDSGRILIGLDDSIFLLQVPLHV